MTEARPSKVRIKALQEYQSLHRTINEMDDIAGRLVAEGPAAVDEALAATSKLFAELSAYVELEELFVLPTIRRVDIWGDIRADALATKHEAQRSDLAAIEHAHRRPVDPQALASDLHEFARGLRDSLDREAHDVLSRDMLRDDVVETKPD